MFGLRQCQGTNNNYQQYYDDDNDNDINNHNNDNDNDDDNDNDTDGNDNNDDNDDYHYDDDNDNGINNNDNNMTIISTINKTTIMNAQLDVLNVINVYSYVLLFVYHLVILLSLSCV